MSEKGKHSMNPHKYMVSMIAILSLLTGCASQSYEQITSAVTEAAKQVDQSIAKSLQGGTVTQGSVGGMEPVSNRPFMKQSGLYQLYRGKEQSSDWPPGWPRVAITVHSLSENAEDEVANRAMGGTLGETCMEFSAVVWSASGKSRKVGRTPFCLMADAMNLDGVAPRTSYQTMQWMTKIEIMCNIGGVCSSGSRNGPNPPNMAYPKGAKYSKKVQLPNTNFVVLADSLIQAMGIDVTESSHESRVWFVSVPMDRDFAR